MEIYTVVVLLDVQRTISDFYVDEFGLDRSLRSMNYYSMQLDWWEDVWGKVRERVSNGENVRTAWTDEWTKTVNYAKGLGMNVFDIGMNWYSWGFDESCAADSCFEYFPYCQDNKKGLSYWFPASEDGNSYYSTPPMTSSVRRGNFWELGIYDIGTARAKIREISNLAHTQGMKVAVYLDPIGLYDPVHNFGCDLEPNQNVYKASWAERNTTGAVKRLTFPEGDVPLLGNPANYAVTASSYGNSPTGSADEHSGFSPSIIDSDLSKGENWNDPSYHYHITKQFRWLVNNYDFDIISVDDTGRVMTGCLGNYGSLSLDSDEV